MKPWLKAVAGGVELLVLVQPRASRSRVIGEHDGRLKVALAAAPVDGEANAALIDLLAALFDVRKSAIALSEGETSRRKRVKVTGLDARAAEAVICVP
ncbi:MAG: DUF167 domain-containing protein [Myxococcaceae bacterium]|nr:DUF167 domain-containing protein [Myxococcaceae bacterium]